MMQRKCRSFWLYLKNEKRNPLITVEDYREGGVITLFVGFGVYLLGLVALGSFIEGAGMLVSTIGLGVLVAGYLYPNTSEEITRSG